MNLIQVRDANGRRTQRLHFIRKVLQTSLSQMKIKNVIVDVTLVQDSEMKKLNFQYRKKNKPTDVLSFGQKDMRIGKQKVLGDIIIAKETTLRQAKKAKHRLKDEYAMLAIHGLLHLLGYDHERIKDEVVMFGLQKKLLNHVQKF